jgi:hypothetical protein
MSQRRRGTGTRRRGRTPSAPATAVDEKFLAPNNIHNTIQSICNSPALPYSVTISFNMRSFPKSKYSEDMRRHLKSIVQRNTTTISAELRYTPSQQVQVEYMIKVGVTSMTHHRHIVCHDWTSFQDNYVTALCAWCPENDVIETIPDSVCDAIRALLVDNDGWMIAGRRITSWYSYSLGLTCHSELSAELKELLYTAIAQPESATTASCDYVSFVEMVTRMVQEFYPEMCQGDQDMADVAVLPSNTAAASSYSHVSVAHPHDILESIPLYRSPTCAPDQCVATIQFHDAGKGTTTLLPYISIKNKLKARVFTSFDIATSALGTTELYVKKKDYQSDADTASESDSDNSYSHSRSHGDNSSPANSPPKPTKLGDFFKVNRNKLLDVPDGFRRCLSNLIGIDSNLSLSGDSPQRLFDSLMVEMKKLQALEIAVHGKVVSESELDNIVNECKNLLQNVSSTAIVFVSAECGTGKSTTAGKWMLDKKYASSQLASIQLLSKVTCRPESSAYASALGTTVPIKLRHAKEYRVRVVFYDEAQTINNISQHLIPNLESDSAIFKIVSEDAVKGWHKSTRTDRKLSTYDLLEGTKTDRRMLGHAWVLCDGAAGLLDHVGKVRAQLNGNQALFMGCKLIEVCAPEFRADIVCVDTPGLSEHSFITFRTQSIVAESDIVAYSMPMGSIRAIKPDNYQILCDHGFYDNLQVRPNHYVDNLRYLMPICGGLSQHSTPKSAVEGTIASAEKETRGYWHRSRLCIQHSAELLPAFRHKSCAFQKYAYFYGMEHDSARPMLQQAIDMSLQYRLLGKLASLSSKLSECIHQTLIGCGQSKSCHERIAHRIVGMVKDASPSSLPRSDVARNVLLAHSRRLADLDIDQLQADITEYVIPDICLLNEESIESTLRHAFKFECKLDLSCIKQECGERWNQTCAAIQRKGQNPLNLLMGKFRCQLESLELQRNRSAKVQCICRFLSDVFDSNGVFGAFLCNDVAKTLCSITNHVSNVLRGPELQLRSELRQLHMRTIQLQLMINCFPGFEFAYQKVSDTHCSLKFDEKSSPRKLDGTCDVKTMSSSSLPMELEFDVSASTTPDVGIDTKEKSDDAALVAARTIRIHRCPSATTQSKPPSFKATIPKQFLEELSQLCASSPDATHPIFHCIEAYKSQKPSLSKLESTSTQSFSFVLDSYGAENQLCFCVVPSIENVLGFCTSVLVDSRRNQLAYFSRNIPWFVHVCVNDSNSDQCDTMIAPQHVLWNLIASFAKAMRQISLPSSQSMLQESIRTHFRMFTMIDGAFKNGFHKWANGHFRPCSTSHVVHRLYGILDERCTSSAKSFTADGRRSAADELRTIINATNVVLSKQVSASLKTFEQHMQASGAVMDQAAGHMLAKVLIGGRRNKVFNWKKSGKIAQRVRSYLEQYYPSKFTSLAAHKSMLHAIYVDKHHADVDRLLHKQLQPANLGAPAAGCQLVPALTVAQESEFSFTPLYDDDDDDDDDEKEDQLVGVSHDNAPSLTAVWLVDLDALTSALHATANSLQLRPAMVCVRIPNSIPAFTRQTRKKIARKITHVLDLSLNLKNTGALCLLTDAMDGVDLCPESQMSLSSAQWHCSNAAEAYRAFCKDQYIGCSHSNGMWSKYFGRRECYIAVEFFYQSVYNRSCPDAATVTGPGPGATAAPPAAAMSRKRKAATTSSTSYSHHSTDLKKPKPT